MHSWFSWVADFLFHNSSVTALDRANAEDAVLPLPKILDSHDKKNRHQNLSSDLDEVMNDVVDSESQAKFMEIKGILMFA